MLITHRVVRCKNCNGEFEVFDDELDRQYLKCPHCHFIVKTELVYAQTKYGYEKILKDSYYKDW